MKKLIFASILLVLTSTIFALDNVETGANIVKGKKRPANYQPTPTVLTPDESYLNRRVYKKNNAWREVEYSGYEGQIVSMTINPKTNPDNDVPNEIHDMDQFILVTDGTALVSFANGPWKKAPKGSWIMVPAYTEHHIKNAHNKKNLKLLTVYSKYDAMPGTVYQTLAEEEAAED